MRTKGRRIESGISRTAEITCLARAASTFERDPRYRSGDYVAREIMPRKFLPVLRFFPIRRAFIGAFYPKGMYEYLIARTKRFDEAFREALAGGVRQVLIFGAGYDSRAWRFADELGDATVFELDAPITQASKIDQLEKRRIPTSPRVAFIPIDFSKENLETRLLESGFERESTSLFLLEGLTMYLDEAAIDSTFAAIDRFSGSGSELLFDYVRAAVLRRENVGYAERRAAEGVRKRGESWVFGLEEDAVASFARSYHFELAEDLDAEALGERYFRPVGGGAIAKLNGSHRIACARKP
jgi:methyltransferase (TIGR00027 family)